MEGLEKIIKSERFAKIRKRATKAAAIGTLSLSLMLQACGGSYFTGGNRVPTRDYASSGNIYVSQNTSVGEAKNPDEMYGNLRRFKSIISHARTVNRYRTQIRSIRSDIKSGNYESVNSRVRNLASQLEGRNDPYSRKLLRKIKNFSYVKFEYVAPRCKVTERTDAGRVIGAPIAYTGAVLVSTLSILKGRNPLKTFENLHGRIKSNLTTRRKTCENGHYNRYRVNPYHGTTTSIGAIQSR